MNFKLVFSGDVIPDTDNQDSDFLKKQELLYSIVKHLEKERATSGRKSLNQADRQKLHVFVQKAVSRAFADRKTSMLLQENQLIGVQTRNYFLQLLAAIEASRLHYEYETKKIDKETHAASFKNIEALAEILESHLNIRGDMGLSDVLTAVQNFYDRTGCVYRLFYFNSSHGRAAIYKGERKSQHKQSLAVYEKQSKQNAKFYIIVF